MFYLPKEAIIASEKLTQYLLVPLPKDDKSKYLAQAGYTLENWEQLEQDIRNQVLIEPAELIESTRYGDKYSIRAYLRGPNQATLKILTIWMMTKGQARFIALTPDKGENS